MKKILLITLCLSMYTGCVMPSGSTVPAVPNVERTAWLSFEDTWTAAKFVYDRYCERAVQGKVSLADQEVIDTAWNAFREVFRAKLVVASQNWSAAAPANVKDSAYNVIVLAKATE